MALLSNLLSSTYVGAQGPTFSIPGTTNTSIAYATSSSTLGSSTDFTYNSATGTLSLLATNAEINLKNITTEPSSPSLGYTHVYTKNVGGRSFLKWKGPSGLDVCVQPLLGQNKISFWSPPGNSTTVPAVFGFNAFTAVGTVTARNVATTNLFTRTKRLGYVSAATSGSICGIYDTTAQYTVSDGSGLGGFYYICRFGASDAVSQSTAKVFVGLTNSVAAPTNVEPSTLTNALGVGANSTDTNLQMYYGGSAAQTRIDLGVNFPKSSASADLYELTMFSPPNDNNDVFYRVVNMTTNATAEGTLTGVAGTAIPSSTTLLSPRCWRITGAAAAVGIDIVSLYIETDY